MINLTKRFEFFTTVNVFIKCVQYRHHFGYTQPWFITKFALLLLWLDVEYSEEVEDYQDTWTEQRQLYLASIALPKTEKVGLKVVKYPFIKLTAIVEPPKVRQMPVLASSFEEAWDTVDKHLWESEDYEATILSIQKATAW